MKNLVGLSKEEYIDYKMPEITKALRIYFKKQNITKMESEINSEALALAVKSFDKIQRLLKRLDLIKS